VNLHTLLVDFLIEVGYVDALARRDVRHPHDAVRPQGLAVHGSHQACTTGDLSKPHFTVCYGCSALVCGRG